MRAVVMTMAVKGLTHRVIVGMTISLDGFVSDRNSKAGRLYPDLAALQDTLYMNDEVARTGAVLIGKRTFEMGDPDSYVGNCEFQVPIFVLTHNPPDSPPKQDEHLTFTFVTDGIESAVAQAKAAAGEKTVVGRHPGEQRGRAADRRGRIAHRTAGSSGRAPAGRPAHSKIVDSTCGQRPVPDATAAGADRAVTCTDAAELHR